MQHYLFVSEICSMMGSHFPRQLGLLVLTSSYNYVHIQSAHVHVEKVTQVETVFCKDETHAGSIL